MLAKSERKMISLNNSFINTYLFVNVRKPHYVTCFVRVFRRCSQFQFRLILFQAEKYLIQDSIVDSYSRTLSPLLCHVKFYELSTINTINHLAQVSQKLLQEALKSVVIYSLDLPLSYNCLTS